MMVRSVMLEGRESGMGFLMTFDVASDSEEEAIRLALCEARELDLDIVGVEEVSLKSEIHAGSAPGVLKRYGKGFFDLQ